LQYKNSLYVNSDVNSAWCSIATALFPDPGSLVASPLEKESADYFRTTFKT